MTGAWETSLGRFVFRHVKIDLFYGYVSVEVATGQQAFVAYPAKALLDLIYLTPNGDAPSFLQELRLQNLERLDQKQLMHFAEQTGSAKLQRAARQLQIIAQAQADEFETL